ncbi:MAG: hypothetical protein AB7T49_08010 [Oligoflexales bacterium]
MCITHIRSAIFLALGLSIYGCGPELKDVNEDKEGTKPGTENLSIVKIPVSVQEHSQQLALASADAFSMSLEGCASKHTATANEMTPNLLVYRYDKNCVTKLTSFTYEGDVYTPSVGNEFDTWMVGDEAVFESASGTLKVVVEAQLSNPVVPEDEVTYTFSEIDEGALKPVPSEKDGHALAVNGQPAPALNISQGVQKDIDINGAGIFEFTMECQSVVTGTVAGANIACQGLSLSDTTFKLIEDTYSSVLTLDDAVTIFQTDELTINSVDYLDANGTTGFKGGFKITAAGPAEMHTHPNMLLIFEGKNTSYLYFNIDLQIIP